MGRKGRLGAKTLADASECKGFRCAICASDWDGDITRRLSEIRVATETKERKKEGEEEEEKEKGVAHRA